MGPGVARRLPKERVDPAVGSRLAGLDVAEDGVLTPVEGPEVQHEQRGPQRARTEHGDRECARRCGPQRRRSLRIH